MKIILTNEFHKTASYAVPKPVLDGRFKGFYKISQRVAKRLKRELCGISGCTCGGNFGERGGDYIELINIDSNDNFIVRI